MLISALTLSTSLCLHRLALFESMFVNLFLTNHLCVDIDCVSIVWRILTFIYLGGLQSPVSSFILICLFNLSLAQRFYCGPFPSGGEPTLKSNQYFQRCPGTTIHIRHIIPSYKVCVGL